MMLELGDDGVVSKVDEENLVYVDEKELEELVDRHNQLRAENDDLTQYKQEVNNVLNSYYQRDLLPIEELLVRRIARELNIDLTYKVKK